MGSVAEGEWESAASQDDGINQEEEAVAKYLFTYFAAALF